MVDFTKLKESMDGIVGNIKTMMNPAGNVPQVDPNDALGVKIAQVSTLVKQMADAQQAQVKQLHQLSQLLSALYQDIEALRAQAGGKPAAPSADAGREDEQVTAPAPEEKVEEVKKEETKE